MAETLQRDEIVVRDIVETARVLFKQSGFKKTTMGDIARSLGKAKSSLYYYYPSKEDIFEAVLHAEMDELLDQIVSLRKKFNSYASYADAGIGDIFPAEKIAHAKVLRCTELASGILYNRGNGQFSFAPLPLPAQFSKVYGAAFDDFDGDGKKDILVSGNFFPYRTQLGRCDASLGMLLKGPGPGSQAGSPAQPGVPPLFQPVDPAVSGMYIGGDVRAMVELKTGAGKKLLVIAKNDDAVQENDDFFREGTVVEGTVSQDPDEPAADSAADAEANREQS